MGEKSFWTSPLASAKVSTKGKKNPEHQKAEFKVDFKNKNLPI
jgi:hypothetical protein